MASTQDRVLSAIGAWQITKTREGVAPPSSASVACFVVRDTLATRESQNNNDDALVGF
jgi:hypothetical protein